MMNIMISIEKRLEQFEDVLKKYEIEIQKSIKIMFKIRLYN